MHFSETPHSFYQIAESKIIILAIFITQYVRDFFTNSKISVYLYVLKNRNILKYDGIVLMVELVQIRGIVGSIAQFVVALS